MGKYMPQYFSFFLILLKGMLWQFTRNFIKIFCLQPDNIRVLLKPKSNNKHLELDNFLNLHGWQSTTTQIETQNHININRKPDCEKRHDKMFCHPLKSLIIEKYIECF